MNLSRMLAAREAQDRPIRVALVGAGKFGSMFMTQALGTPGMRLVALADLMPQRARERLVHAGYPDAFDAVSPGDAARSGHVHVTDDTIAAITHEAVDVVVEATGDPATGIALCLAAIAAGKHVVMANVEADAVAGPLLARRAQEAGVVYSLAWGDQPALIIEHVDWARACGFEVVCAGKGTRHRPHFHASTPDTVWDVVAKYVKRADRSLTDPRMFNSFTDGSKSAIEMTAVCNATGLRAQADGLRFPPASCTEISTVCRPRDAGGQIDGIGVTECISSIGADGEPLPDNLMMGTFVVFRGETDYARRCLAEYRALTDPGGEYAALYRPTHMIGLELGISIASVALRGEPTGSPTAFVSDVAATAKRPLTAGEVLDGEGGFCVWGRQVPAERSLADGLLPLGLASGLRLTRDIAEGERVRWDDVAFDPADAAIRFRREMERAFAPAPSPSEVHA